jgi:hypothetical protein
LGTLGVPELRRTEVRARRSPRGRTVGQVTKELISNVRRDDDLRGYINYIKALVESARRPMLEWFGWSKLLTLCDLGGPWLAALGIVISRTSRCLVAGVAGLLILMPVRAYSLLRAVMKAREHAHLRRLRPAAADRPILDFGWGTGGVVASPQWVVTERAIVS